MKIGYARVSSSTQDLELQTQALQAAGCVRIFSEAKSGRDNNRPQLLAMMQELRDHDIVIVYKIDRMARSLKGLIEIIEVFKHKKVDLVSLDAGDRVDTTSPLGKAFFQMAGVFAELERGMIHARTQAGIARAQAQGMKFGRTLGSQNKQTAFKIERIKIFLQAGKSYHWISRELRVSKQTISQVKQRHITKKD